MHQRNVDALLRAWNEGDLDGLDGHVAPGARRLAPVSVNSSADSLAELKERIRDFRTAFPDCHVSLDEVFFQGDRSFARWTFEGTNTGPGDFPATGKQVKVSGTSFGRYADGQLTEEIVNFDALDMMSQLGIIELPTAEG